MSFLLVFDHTGDEIPIDPIEHSALEFYVEKLNQLSLNNFRPESATSGKKIHDLLNGLRDTIVDVNAWLYDMADITIDQLEIEDYLDQQTLNKIHADWVASQSKVYNIQQKRQQSNHSERAELIHNMFPDDIQHPPLNDVLDKLGLLDFYNSINVPYVHGIEDFFEDITSDKCINICRNPFSKKLQNNNISNVQISFRHLGRTRFNKFINFDKNLSFRDENNYDELIGEVTLNLHPPETIPYSKEYISWCNENNVEPVGKFLNIGNIPNLYENLTKYRKIIFKNLLSNHGFSIQHT
jgi:hypothetical protein